MYGLLELNQEDVTKLLTLLESDRLIEDYKFINHLVDKYPGNRDLMLLIADSYYEKGIYTQALEFYNYIIQMDPNNLDCLLSICKCSIAMNKYDEFFEVKQKMEEELNKQTNEYKFNLRILTMLVYLKQNNTEEVAKIIKELIDIDEKLAKNKLMNFVEQLVIPNENIEQKAKIELYNFVSSL